jgi:MFS family permease
MQAGDIESTTAVSEPTPLERNGTLGPFHHRTFAVLWIATVVANVGTWMQSAAAGWFMTTLNPDPFIVSMVQVAASLPMFLFAIPAGALGDVVDRRKLIIVIQITVTLLVMGFVALIRLNVVTPSVLLAFLFLATSAAALIMPVWQSIVPQLVPRTMLQSAVALNSAGVNVSRAVGPALAGVIITAWGMDAPFWLNALSNVGVIAALLWWRPRDTDANRNAPPERFFLAIGAGLRYARHNPHLRATQIRRLDFSYSQVRIGHYCHWLRAIKSRAGLHFTAFCSVRSALVPWAALLRCHYSREPLGRTGWLPQERSAPPARFCYLQSRGKLRLHLLQACLLAFHGSPYWRHLTSLLRLRFRNGYGVAVFQYIIP